VRSLLRVTLATLAIAAVPALAAQPAAHAQPAAQAKAQAKTQTQAHGGIAFAIDGITPRYAQADSTITVTGTVANHTGTAQSGLTVQLYSGVSPFSARDLMEEYLTSTSSTGTSTPIAEGDPATVSVGAGATVTWHAQFTAEEAQLSGFGVYPLQAILESESGGIAGTDRTLLPYWPGSAAGISKLKISWIWPMIDQPLNQVCPALTSNELATSVTSQGRLGTLLTAGADNPGADLTWAVDPALLANVSAMEKPYQVGGSPADCTGAKSEPPSSAAGTWLKALSSATAGTNVILTPYANVDMAALVHRDMTPDLTAAYQLGDRVAQNVLHGSFWTDVALPAGGLADQPVLAALASPAGERMTSVVLGSGEMPAQGSNFTPDDAVTSLRTMSGTSMTVLLADDTMTDLLKQANGNLSASARFAVEQQFLAETAMIASEVPDSDRSVVISPPETWAPSLSLASDLLSETTGEPWLQPATLSSLTSSRVNTWQANRANPPVSQYSSRELSAHYLQKAAAAESNKNVFQSMLYLPSAQYTSSLNLAVAATESSAWRDGNSAGGTSLVNGLKSYVSRAEKRVQIIISASGSQASQIQMAGAAGELPVTIQNGLEQQTIKVRLNTSVLPLAGKGDTLTISPQKVVIIPPGQTILLKPAIHGATQGSHTIDLSLSSANGTVLPFTQTQVVLNSTRFGQAILIVIAGAIGLLLLTSVFRSRRRRLAGHPSDDSAGNVVADHTEAEAPDDLADARRGADDS
jgi:Family of unknown function (DUF6049)